MNAIELIESEQEASAPSRPTEPRQLTVIEHAIRSGASPEQLQSLLELQVRADNHQLEMMREKRRMDDEDRKAAALLAYRRDFAAFRGENIVIAKSKHVDRGRAGSFMQAEYHAIAQQLSPALSRHGFSFRHDQRFGVKELPTAENPHNRMGWVWVTCFLEHRDGHSESIELEGPEGDQSANTPVQNMQLTASYLKRQSLLAITGTATGGEDDENAMRGRRNAEDGADDTLLQAGRDASLEGVAALNAWWGSLTGKQRSKFTAEFPSLRSAARAADEAPATSYFTNPQSGTF